MEHKPGGDDLHAKEAQAGGEGESQVEGDEAQKEGEGQYAQKAGKVAHDLPPKKTLSPWTGSRQLKATVADHGESQIG